MDAKPGRKQIDENTEFSNYDFIKEGSTFFLVCDQYNTLAVREHIKQTVASVSGNLPLLGLISKKQEEVLPQSLLDFHKLVSEADKTKPIDLNGKLKEYYFDEETVKKDQELKSEIAKPTFPIKFNPESVNYTSDLLNKKKEYPLRSMILPAYNPPRTSRQLVGDLLYLRV